jgi:hypothetical protein
MIREVHMSDLIRANEGNGDFNDADPSKIHWGKFNMMGRFVDTTTQCQIQCSNSNDYDFPERPAVAELFVKRPVMSPEVSLPSVSLSNMSNQSSLQLQKARLALLDSDFDDSKPSNSNQAKSDITGLRKMFFW